MADGVVPLIGRTELVSMCRACASCATDNGLTDLDRADEARYETLDIDWPLRQRRSCWACLAEQRGNRTIRDMATTPEVPDLRALFRRYSRREIDLPQLHALLRQFPYCQEFNEHRAFTDAWFDRQQEICLRGDHWCRVIEAAEVGLLPQEVFRQLEADLGRAPTKLLDRRAAANPARVGEH